MNEPQSSRLSAQPQAIGEIKASFWNLPQTINWTRTVASGGVATNRGWKIYLQDTFSIANRWVAASNVGPAALKYPSEIMPEQKDDRLAEVTRHLRRLVVMRTVQIYMERRQPLNV